MVYFIGSSHNISADLVEWAYNADCKTDESAVKPPTDIPVSSKTKTFLYKVNENYLLVEALTKICMHLI